MCDVTQHDTDDDDDVCCKSREVLCSTLAHIDFTVLQTYSLQGNGFGARNLQQVVLVVRLLKVSSDAGLLFTVDVYIDSMNSNYFVD